MFQNWNSQQPILNRLNGVNNKERGMLVQAGSEVSVSRDGGKHRQGGILV